MNGRVSIAIVRDARLFFLFGKEDCLMLNALALFVALAFIDPPPPPPPNFFGDQARQVTYTRHSTQCDFGSRERWLRPRERCRFGRCR